MAAQGMTREETAYRELFQRVVLGPVALPTPFSQWEQRFVDITLRQLVPRCTQVCDLSVLPAEDQDKFRERYAIAQENNETLIHIMAKRPVTSNWVVLNRLAGMAVKGEVSKDIFFSKNKRGEMPIVLMIQRCTFENSESNPGFLYPLKTLFNSLSRDELAAHNIIKTINQVEALCKCLMRYDPRACGVAKQVNPFRWAFVKTFFEYSSDYKFGAYGMPGEIRALLRKMKHPEEWAKFFVILNPPFHRRYWYQNLAILMDIFLEAKSRSVEQKPAVDPTLDARVEALFKSVNAAQKLSSSRTEILSTVFHHRYPASSSDQSGPSADSK